MLFGSGQCPGGARAGCREDFRSGVSGRAGWWCLSEYLEAGGSDLFPWDSEWKHLDQPHSPELNFMSYN